MKIGFQSTGISSGDIAKLKEAGYYTYESLAFTTRRELRNVKGISDQKAEKIMVSVARRTERTVIEMKGSCMAE